MKPKYRYRVGWRGRLVLQIFEDQISYNYITDEWRGRWRDATYRDFIQLPLPEVKP